MLRVIDTTTREDGWHHSFLFFIEANASNSTVSVVVSRYSDILKSVFIVIPNGLINSIIRVILLSDWVSEQVGKEYKYTFTYDGDFITSVSLSVRGEKIY